MQRVSKWDIKQWQSAVNDLEVDGWLPEAKKRVTVLGAVAGLSVGSMMSAIAGLAVVSLFSKQIKSINERVAADQSTEIDRMQHAFDAPKSMAKKAKAYADKVQNEPLQPRYEDKPPIRKVPRNAKGMMQQSRLPLSQSLWNNADKLMNDLENTLLDHFKKGMGLDDLHDMVQKHVNDKQFDPKGNIADRTNQEDYQIRRLVRTESARMKDRVNDYYYKQNGIKYVNWVCEPGACAKCLGLSLAGPYPIGEAPRNPDDSHPNCRCGKVPALDAKDQLPTDLNKGFFAFEQAWISLKATEVQAWNHSKSYGKEHEHEEKQCFTNEFAVLR